MLTEHIPRALEHMDRWVNQLAAGVAPPARVHVSEDDFVWRHPEETPEVGIVSKSVRLTSSLAAAWKLANVGLTTEAGSLCRQVGDFSHEIWFLAESVLSGDANRAQRRFLELHFQPMARDIDTYLSQERAYWVSRGEIAKVVSKLAKQAGADAELREHTARFISYGLNSYTHGGYESAMELYHGGHKRFMILGFEDGRVKEASKGFVASKSTEACHALEAAALALRAYDLSAEIRSFVREADPYL